MIYCPLGTMKRLWEDEYSNTYATNPTCVSCSPESLSFTTPSHSPHLQHWHDVIKIALSLQFFEAAELITQRLLFAIPKV